MSACLHTQQRNVKRLHSFARDSSPMEMLTGQLVLMLTGEVDLQVENNGGDYCPLSAPAVLV